MSSPLLEDRPLRGKYAPLHRYLRQMEEGRWDATFRQIEALLGRPLPASASTYPAWWANNWTHRQALAWLKAGWVAEGPDIHGGTVTFRRRWPNRTAGAR